MHQYQFDALKRRNNPQKRVFASSRREVVLERPKKQSRPLSSRLSSQVLILTSRLNSRDEKILPVKFYEKPKSLLEQQYERNLSKFIPLCDTSADFTPLLDSALPREEVSKPEVEGDEKQESQETEPEVEINSELVSQLIEQNDTEIHIDLLLHLADHFLALAHSTVLEANSISGTKQYYTYVKSALKALYMLLDVYGSRLNPSLELSVYFKLAHIYFSETSNSDLAEIYASKSISLAARHNLLGIKASSEFLYGRILESSQSSLLEQFYAERQKFYTEISWLPVADMFGLLRANLLLISDFSGGVAALPRPSSGLIVEALCLLLKANLSLYRGPLGEFENAFAQAQVCLERLSALPQLLAMAHLTQLAYLIQIDDTQQSKVAIQRISDFVSEQRSSKWSAWQESGSIPIEIPSTTDLEVSIPFEVKWMNSDEFVIAFYFLSGVSLLSERSNIKRAHKVLSNCLDVVQIQLDELTQAKKCSRSFSLHLLTEKIVRLNFIRYYVYYYKIWLDFMYKDDFTGISMIKYFVDNFDSENFTTEELCYYKLLIPRFYYLSGLYFHSQGDLNAAKYYYQRVRNLGSTENANLVPAVSLLQRDVGIGCEHLLPKENLNDLYIYSTFHLLIIAEYEMQQYSQCKEVQNRNKLSSIRASLASLYADLTSAFESTNNQSFVGFSPISRMTFKLLSCVYINKGFETKSLNSSHFTDLNDICHQVGGFVGSLVNYVLHRLSVTLSQSQDHLLKSREMAADGNKSSSFMKLILLQEQLAKSSENGDSESSGLLELEKKKLWESLSSLVELAHNSII